MSDVARAVLVGRLTRDPELNDSGKVLNLGLAVNRSVKRDDQWVEEVSFFDVKVLGNRAPALHGFLAKGRQVAVDARIVQERWQNQEGQNRSVVRFIADEVVPLGPKDDGQPPRSDIPVDTDDFPVAASVGADDDIPFLWREMRFGQVTSHNPFMR